MKDRFDLMEVAVNSMHGVVLADVFAEIQQALGHNRQPELFQNFSTYGVAQRLSVILPAAGQHEELTLLSANPHREDIAATQDDGARRRPDP